MERGLKECPKCGEIVATLDGRVCFHLTPPGYLRSRICSGSETHSPKIKPKPTQAEVRYVFIPKAPDEHKDEGWYLRYLDTLSFPK